MFFSTSVTLNQLLSAELDPPCCPGAWAEAAWAPGDGAGSPVLGGPIQHHHLHATGTSRYFWDRHPTWFAFAAQDILLFVHIYCKSPLVWSSWPRSKAKLIAKLVPVLSTVLNYIIYLLHCPQHSNLAFLTSHPWRVSAEQPQHGQVCKKHTRQISALFHLLDTSNLILYNSAHSRDTSDLCTQYAVTFRFRLDKVAAPRNRIWPIK